MTATAMQGDREKCIAAGVVGCLSKPSRPARLGETPASWLEPETA